MILEQPGDADLLYFYTLPIAACSKLLECLTFPKLPPAPTYTKSSGAATNDDDD
jgi:hypothetical protein